MSPKRLVIAVAALALSACGVLIDTDHADEEAKRAAAATAAAAAADGGTGSSTTGGHDGNDSGTVVVTLDSGGPQPWPSTCHSLIDCPGGRCAASDDDRSVGTCTADTNACVSETEPNRSCGSTKDCCTGDKCSAGTCVVCVPLPTAGVQTLKCDDATQPCCVGSCNSGVCEVDS